MIVNEVLDLGDEMNDVFFRNGLKCQGCPGGLSESLEEAAEGHGINLKKLLLDLNEQASRM